MYWKVGQNLGTVATFNVFIPLNSVEWLNSKLFTNTPLQKPLISHPIILNFISIFILCVVFFITFFVKEKEVKKGKDFGIIKIFTKNIPQMFSNKYNLYLIFFILITNAGLSMFTIPTDLTFIK